MDQEAGDLIAVDYGLYQSLSGPSRRRVLRDADMDQPPPTEGKYDEDVEHGEPGRHDREVVAGPSLLSLRRSMSMGGRPRRRRDRHRQSRRQPARCHRMRVSGLTTRTVARRSRKFPTRVASNQRSKGRRRGRLTCLRGTTTCWRRSRFSAASAARGPGPRARGLAETAGGWSRQLRPYHGSGLGGGVRRPSPFPAGRLYCGGQALRDRPSRDTTANVLRVALEDLRQKLRFATPEDRRDIVRAVLAKDENAVKIGPERIEARLLLAPEGRSGVAQVYRTG